MRAKVKRNHAGRFRQKTSVSEFFQTRLQMPATASIGTGYPEQRLCTVAYTQTDTDTGVITATASTSTALPKTVQTATITLTGNGATNTGVVQWMAARFPPSTVRVRASNICCFSNNQPLR